MEWTLKCPQVRTDPCSYMISLSISFSLLPVSGSDKQIFCRVAYTSHLPQRTLLPEGEPKYVFVSPSKLPPFLSRRYTSCSEEEEDSCFWRRRPSELSEAFNRR